MSSQETVKTKSRMFPFITATWNPVGGACSIDCGYCWAKALIKKYNMQKYQGEARLFPKELQKQFKETDFVFVSDMRDLFDPKVPDAMIQTVLDYISKSPAKFLLLTKYPRRYLSFKLPQNTVAGATIETDLGKRQDRFIAMRQLNHAKMVSIEPVMEFSLTFQEDLFSIYPSFVAIGYDNYDNHLEEPELEDVEALISGFINRGIKVYRKTLREKR